MKKLLFIILFLLTLSASAQLTTAKVWYFRHGNTEGRKPVSGDFSKSNTYAYSTADSLLWISQNGVIKEGFTFYPYAEGTRRVHKVAVTSEGRYNAPFYQNSVKTTNTAGFNILKSHFTAANTLIINWADSTASQLVRGVVTKTWRIYVYDTSSVAPPAPEFPTLNTRIYVSVSGSDSSVNHHSPVTPYRTLGKAASESTSGDTIFIFNGTYIFTTLNIPVGVSVTGQGDSTILISNHVVGRVGGVSTGSVNLISASEGTNGNQSISNLKLIGTGTPNGTIGIVVKKRSNVTIHDITVFDFEINGITFMGGATEFTIPTTYATGNQIYNCDIRKCGTSNIPYTDWKNGGLIKWAGQDGMLVHHNYFSNKERAYEHNDNIVSIGYANKGCKYYNNESYKPDNDGQAWSIHIESWELEGGFEIYNNQFIGGDMAIDCAGHYANKGSYDYTYSIHDNYFAPNVAYGDNYHPINAICIEGLLQQYAYVYNNHFYKHPQPIVIQGTSWGASITRDIYVFKNLFEACGQNNAGAYDNIMYVGGTVSGSVFNSINILNNTIISDITRNTGIKIQTGTGVSLTTLNYKNNIVLSCTNGAFMNVVNSGSINGLTVTYNLLNGNSNSNLPTFSGNAVSNYTISNNVNSAPLFVGGRDFRLQVTSPAKDAGTAITIPVIGELPYTGTSPDIGAFEYTP